MLKNSPKLLTGILQGFGIVHFWLASGFDFLFFQKHWLFAYFFDTSQDCCKGYVLETSSVPSATLESNF